ncbi:MAG TPA: hypothetical protein PKG60_16875 [Spirochaetota bacterium]|nr:hypothetical protein [Spirochaetota bacterium]HPS87632.1 hypothetical protein [Spirochaetota bacterium]
MNIQVVYHDNKMGEIDKALLDEMISVNRIRMFMRSDGWAMVGVADMRGSGGMYTGLDRRELSANKDTAEYKIVV